jgi:hypothetical protein
VQGYSIELKSTAVDVDYHADGPSLLGMPYAAVHSPGEMVVGSTKQTGLSAADALAALAPAGIAADSSAVEAALQLQNDMATVWESVHHWDVLRVRSGARAMQLEMCARSVNHCAHTTSWTPVSPHNMSQHVMMLLTPERYCHHAGAQRSACRTQAHS